MRHPHVLQLIMDSLRYWVDGDARRRLPLRPRRHPGPPVPRGRPAVGVLRPRPAGPGHLARSSSSPSRGTSATAATRSATSRRCGPSGTASTATPCATSGAASRATLGEFASRLTGSSDLYEHTRPPPDRLDQLRHRPRRLHAARPGLVQREAQRGQRRGRRRRREPQPLVELRRRGRRPTTPAINALRRRQQRNFLATLLLCQGVPMISHGDEMGRTQQGNNNVYCQDNELSWVDWDLDDDAGRPADVHPRAVKLRREHPVLRRRRFFAGAPTARRRVRARRHRVVHSRWPAHDRGRLG